MTCIKFRRTNSLHVVAVSLMCDFIRRICPSMKKDLHRKFASTNSLPSSFHSLGHPLRESDSEIRAGYRKTLCTFNPVVTAANHDGSGDTRPVLPSFHGENRGLLAIAATTSLVLVDTPARTRQSEERCTWRVRQETVVMETYNCTSYGDLQ